MTTTLVYSDCNAHAAGDYSAAAEVAYALENYYYTIGEDSHCILASSEEGVKVLENLYGSPNGIEIHGKPFQVVNLNDFVNDEKKKDVTQYIEVAFCKPAPMDLIAKIVDPLSTKVLMVSLPHYTTNVMEATLRTRFPQSYANGLAHAVAEGFGKDRIGVLVHQGPFEPLKEEDYCGITKYPYGFAYFKGGLDHSKHTLVDYLKISTSINNSYNNFVFVGDCKLNLEAIKEYVLITKKPAEVCDLSTRTIYKVTPNNSYDFNIQQSLMPKDYEINGKDQSCIHVCLLPKVVNTQMRSLMKFAQPFVSAEGVNTVIEAIAFGKIPFIQYMSNNEDLYPIYRKALLENCPPDYSSAIARLFDLCLKNEYLNGREKDELRALLNDENVTNALIQTNLALVNNGKNPAKQMVEELHKPGAIDNTYTGPAFGHDFYRASSLLKDLFRESLMDLLLKSNKNTSGSSSRSSTNSNSIPSYFSPTKSPLRQLTLFGNKNSLPATNKFNYMNVLPMFLFDFDSVLPKSSSKPNPLEAHLKAFNSPSPLRK